MCCLRKWYKLHCLAPTTNTLIPFLQVLNIYNLSVSSSIWDCYVVLGRGHTRTILWILLVRDQTSSGFLLLCVCLHVCVCFSSMHAWLSARTLPHTWLISAVISAGILMGSPGARGVLPYQIFVTCDSCLSERILSDTAQRALQRFAWVMRSLLTLFLPDSDFIFASYLFGFWSCLLSSFCSRLFSYRLCSSLSKPHKQQLKVTEPPSTSCFECQLLVVKRRD